MLIDTTFSFLLHEIVAVIVLKIYLKSIYKPCCNKIVKRHQIIGSSD